MSASKPQREPRWAAGGNADQTSWPKGESNQHSSRDFGVLWEMFDAAPNHYPSERAALQRIEEQYEVAKRERDEIGAALGEPCAECGHIDWRSDGYFESVEQEWLRLAGVQAARAEELQEQLEAARAALDAIVNAKSYVNAGGYAVTADEAQALAIKRAADLVSNPASAPVDGHPCKGQGAEYLVRQDNSNPASAPPVNTAAGSCGTGGFPGDPYPAKEPS